MFLQVNAAIKTGQWTTAATLAVADIGIGFSDILISAAFKNEIQTSFPRFYDTWQKISLCYGIGRISQAGLVAAFKHCYLESRIMRNRNTFSNATQNTAQQIELKLQDPANFAELLDNTAIANELTFFMNVDIHYAEVLFE